MSHLNTCIDRGRAGGWGGGGQSRLGPCLLGPCLHCPLPLRNAAPRGDSGWAEVPGLLPGLCFPWMELGSNLAAAERRGRMVRGGMRWVQA